MRCRRSPLRGGLHVLLALVVKKKKTKTTWQCRRCKWHRFDPWVRKIPWRRATHSGILAWKIPRTEEPGGLQSMELQRVRHDSATEHTHICPYCSMMSQDGDIRFISQRIFTIISWSFLFFSLSFLFFELWKYDNTFTGDLENTEQSYIWFYYILSLFLSR